MLSYKGFLCSNEQSSILTATFISLAFFLFSDIVTHLEAMPMTATLIARNTLFVLSQGIFRKIIIFDIGFDMLRVEIFKLILYALVTFTLLVVIAKFKNKKRL